MCCIFQKMLLHRLADFVTLCDTEMIKSTHLSKHAEFIFSVFCLQFLQFALCRRLKKTNTPLLASLVTMGHVLVLSLAAS